MKKLLLFLCFFSFLTAFAQFNVGIKAGANYNNFNDLNITGGSFGINEFVNSKNAVGYHIGVFSQMKLLKIFLRAELLYIQNKGSYESRFSNASDFKLSTLELPVLVGFKIIGPLNLYVGPSFVYNIDSDFSDFFDLRFERDLNVTYNIGTSVTINKFGIDLRYSNGFSKNVASYLDDIPLDGVGYSINTKPSQFLLSLSYQIN